jgi:hypothetical protein
LNIFEKDRKSGKNGDKQLTTGLDFRPKICYTEENTKGAAVWN